MPYLVKLRTENQELKKNNAALKKNNAALKKQIRLLLAGGREYAGHGESCVWCELQSGRHEMECETKKARALLKEKP
jgi:hypothetical protein